ncbi:RagB/SusD family nutrient uptake outer membrane protein [Adhaeribacter arboris]|uniref:RagB/SusD family nutrient uptake outer membrane protein n=1 Tax=Adhaeribacter arboris TaxID=2072846 RepID=A0A2T2YEU0_9BACT|nr:RagB/SusD family nutrient uptake outer membrane protein [Adhaeribacter arboris]PSR54036.1 RagB/SusD family nutrient uptake outer membrane protein [Adhaeribacter arboris]
MKATKIIWMITSLLLIIVTGCEKEVLNKKSRSSFTDEDVWQDINLAEKLVFSTYDALGGWGWPQEGAGGLLSTATDEAFMLFDYGFWPVSSGTIDASNMGVFTNSWRDGYKSIRNINIFLNRIDNVPGADPEKVKRLKGEMKFIRAKAYADLISFFGGVPLITNVYSLNDEFTEKRASYQECVNFIVKELDEAKEMVPPTVTAENWGKVTQGACLALKSEVLLYAASKLHDPASTPNGPLFTYDQANKWQQASDAAKAVIDLNYYSLVPVNTWQEYTQIFLKANPEIIFARPYSPEFSHPNIDQINTPNGYNGWSGNIPSQNLVDDFKMMDGTNFDWTNPEHAAEPYKNRDPRFYANIVYQGATYRGRQTEFFLPGGLDSRDGPESWNYATTGYSMRKFMDESLDFKKGLGKQPFIFFRLAEMYLNYAEAQYYLGNEAVAKEYVNKIRARVHMPEINSSGAQLLEDIQHERRIELCFESKRFFDVRRWMIAEETGNKNAKGIEWKKENGVLKYNIIDVQQRSFTARMYYLPIPLSEINKTGLEQNPGY